MNPEAIKIAIAIIKQFEGYAKRLPDGGCTAYPDPGTGADPWTIGYGCTGANIKKGTVWTKDQAERALENEVIHFMKAVLQHSPGLSEEAPRRLAAITSFAFNCGIGNYRISTLKRRVNERDWAAAAQEIKRWNRAAGRVMPGLTRRREAESLLLQ